MPRPSGTSASPLSTISCAASAEMIAAAEHHPLARQRTRDAGDGFQERSLAGAVGAEDRHDLTPVDKERDTVECAVQAIGQAEIVDLKHRRPLRRDRP